MNYEKEEHRPNMQERIDDRVQDKCASRERLESLIRRIAEQKEQEAKSLYNLAKAIELLPNELEQLLYPFISDSLYRGTRV